MSPVNADTLTRRLVVAVRTKIDTVQIDITVNVVPGTQTVAD